MFENSRNEEGTLTSYKYFDNELQAFEHAKEIGDLDNICYCVYVSEFCCRNDVWHFDLRCTYYRPE